MKSDLGISNTSVTTLRGQNKSKKYTPLPGVTILTALLITVGCRCQYKQKVAV